MCYNNLNEEKVSNQANKTNLEYINIYGLFGTYDIKIPFDKQVNIFIGENGLGKTTILNCIYFILEKKFSRLANIQFTEIDVKFQNSSKVYKISIDDVRKFSGKYDNNFIKNILIKYDNSKSKEKEKEKITYEINDISREINKNIAIKQIQHYIENINSNISVEVKSKNNNVLELSKAISEKIKDRIIYLPTYRRIEDDFTLLNFSSDEINEEESLIRFGMSDVQNSINKILKQIQLLAMKGFREMTGVLLKQYTDSDDLTLNKYKNFEIDIDTVKIVLDRVGKEIEEQYKRKILSLMKSNKIKNPEYLYLFNLINKLIDNYDLQKKYDDRIKKFTDTCNKYLNDKHFDYNQSTLSLEIYLNNKKRPLELTQLSSGEKQIVSLFSKLYLESDECSIIIIDEPELSLSIQWQKMLLPDIMRANNCNLLITVTHSPFIFENEFDYDAKEMRKYRSNKLR